MSHLKRILLVLFLGSCLSTPALSSELGDAAANLAPGEWTRFTVTGFNDNLLLQDEGHHVLQYTDSMKWDPVRNEVNFVGSGHLQPYKHIVYAESNNSWASQSVPSYFGTSHGYDHMALDPVGRKLYFRYFNNDLLEIYDLDNKNWSRSSRLTADVWQVAGGMAWFPERKGVVFADSSEISMYLPANNSWKSLSTNVGALGPYHNFAEYSPEHKLVIYGGGNDSRAIFQIDSSGTITRKANAPFNLGITASIIVVDPVSGNFLVFTDSAFYEYDPIADSWKKQSVSIPFRNGVDNGVFGAAAVPISTHGVVMIVKYDGNNSKVFLYKHAAGSGTPPPPPPPPPAEPPPSAPPPSPPPPSGSADEDWIARSSAVGVVMATRFDSSSDVSSGVLQDSMAGNVSWDQNVKTSGAGSLRFAVKKSDQANSGNWRHYLADDRRVFGQGDDYYVQYRQYVPAYYAEHKFRGTGSGNAAGGWKSSILSWYSSSFQNNEVVVQNSLHRGYVQGYNQDGDFNLWESNISTACSPRDFVHQPQVDNGRNPLGSGFTACENDRARYGGLYSYDGGGQDPLTGAFLYYPDEWITILQRVKIGNFGQSNTLIETWAARDGQDYVMLYSDPGRRLGGDNGGHNAMWLLPYNTERLANSSRLDTYTNYDEVIVSTNFIAAPGFPAAGTPPASTKPMPPVLMTE